MAITQAASPVAGSANNGNDVTLNFPTLQQDDYVVLFAGRGRGTGGQMDEVAASIGYTEARIEGSVAASADAQAGVWIKKMGASPDTAVTVPGTGNAQDCIIGVAYFLRGVDGTTPVDVTPVSNFGTGVDPPAITTATNGAWVFPLVVSGTSDTSVTVLSGYSEFVRNNQSETRPATVVVCYKEITTAGSENPPAYSDLTDANNPAKITVAFRPASGAPPAINAAPSAIATVEAFGTLVQTGVVTTSPTALATVEAFGSPLTSIALGVAPPSIASAETFGAPVIAAVVTTSPTSLASTEAFGNLALASLITALPGGMATQEAFGVLAISSALNLAPNGLASVEVVSNPILATVVGLHPVGIATVGAFGALLVSPYIGVSPIGVSTAEGIGSPSIDNRLTLAPTGLVTAEDFGTTLLTSLLTVLPSGLASGQVFGSPSVLPRINLDAVGIPSAEASGAPILQTSITLLVSDISSVEGFGAPDVTVLAPVAFIPFIGWGVPL